MSIYLYSASFIPLWILHPTPIYIHTHSLHSPSNCYYGVLTVLPWWLTCICVCVTDCGCHGYISTYAWLFTQSSPISLCLWPLSCYISTHPSATNNRQPSQSIYTSPVWYQKRKSITAHLRCWIWIPFLSYSLQLLHQHEAMHWFLNIENLCSDLKYCLMYIHLQIWHRLVCI